MYHVVHRYVFDVEHEGDLPNSQSSVTYTTTGVTKTGTTWDGGRWAVTLRLR